MMQKYVLKKTNCARFCVETDLIFSASSKVQNYQNKTGEKSLYQSK